MGADNGFRFIPTPEYRVKAELAIQEMINAGWEASTEDIELIAAGDQDVAEEQFKLVPGYPELTAALTEIFDGDGGSVAH